MCNTHQQNPQQNQPWQGVYPDLSVLNELFSPQAAVNSETTFSSPWIAFLRSLGLHMNNPPLRQLLGQRGKTVKPFLEQTLLPVKVRVTTNHLRVLHSLPHNPMVTPADTPVAPPTSPSCSRQSPPASSTSPQSPPGPPSPSSASWPSSASSPASPASSSSPPSMWCWPPPCSAFPCPPCWPATSSTPPSPSSTPSVSSSSCFPAFTGCMSAANHWLIQRTGEFASLGPTQLGLNTETITIEFFLHSIEPL